MNFQHALAEAILSSSGDAIVATDKDGIIRFWNSGAERIFGYVSADALGRSLDIIIPERLRARHWHGYHEVIATGKSRYGDGDILAVPGLRADGARISVEFTIVLLRDDAGRIIGMAAIMRDVTKRFQEVQQLRRKLAEAVAASGSGDRP